MPAPPAGGVARENPGPVATTCYIKAEELVLDSYRVCDADRTVMVSIAIPRRARARCKRVGAAAEEREP